MMKAVVSYGKVKGFRPQWDEDKWGISNNRGGEIKKEFVQEAMRENARRCKGLQTFIRQLRGE